MQRLGWAITGVLWAGVLAAQEGRIEQATIRKLDLDAMTIVLRTGGEERTYHLTPGTQVLGAKGNDLREKLRDFKEGSAILFKAVKKDDKMLLVGLRLDDRSGAGAILKDTSKLVPLTEMGDKEYQGLRGGLYPDGKNQRPQDHERAGLALAKLVQSLDAEGKPSPQGKIVLLSIGMSNTSQASQGFQKQLAKAEGVNPRLLFVNGAQGGMTAALIQNPDDGKGKVYWEVVDQKLKAAGATRAQVQAVWIKQADAGPTQGFPAYAKKLRGELARIVQLLPERFPNLKLVYLSSRTYGGFATTALNPEPYAYESAFSVRWLIEEQIQGEPSLNFDPKRGAVRAPWLSWGPYLWANGAAKRADGFFYEVGDFAKDGTHHSPAGQDKQGRLLLDFFRSDTTARPWFTAR
jgi:hypothetical protein